MENGQVGRIRIKSPSGAEFEAEGPIEFIIREKEKFLDEISTGPKIPASAVKRNDEKAAEAHDGGQTAIKKEEAARAETAATVNIASSQWEQTVADKTGYLMLKIKHYGLKPEEAAIILLAASSEIKKAESMSALILSKSIKASGYSPSRLDRLLMSYIKDGLLLASGTKRNRSYRITRNGLSKAAALVYNISKQQNLL